MQPWTWMYFWTLIGFASLFPQSLLIAIIDIIQHVLDNSKWAFFFSFKIKLLLFDHSLVIFFCFKYLSFSVYVALYASITFNEYPENVLWMRKASQEICLLEWSIVSSCFVFHNNRDYCRFSPAVLISKCPFISQIYFTMLLFTGDIK